MAFLVSCIVNVCVLFVMGFVMGIVGEVETSWDSQVPISDHYIPVVLRLKRSPYRTFTYSGFNPANGMTALASSGDFQSTYYGFPPMPSFNNYPTIQNRQLDSAVNPTDSDYSPDYQPPSGEYPSSISSGGIDEDRKLFPSQNLTPPAEQAPTSAYGQNALEGVKKPKKKPIHVENDDDDDDISGKAKSSSSASFNAWFPIMVGWAPPNQGNAASTYKEDSGSSAPSKERLSDRGLGTTVIANSVSHGKSSVASSHAIAYGDDPSLRSYRQG